MLTVKVACACAANVGAWCDKSASDRLGTAVPVQLSRRRLAAGVGDAVAGRTGAVVVFAVVVGHAACSGRGRGGGGVGFGDGEDGDVVIEGWFDGVGGGGGVEVGLLGGRVRRLLGRVGRLLGRVGRLFGRVGRLLGRVGRCLRSVLLRLGLLVLHLRHRCCDGVCLPAAAAAATHTAPCDQGGEDGEDDDDDANCDADYHAGADAGVGGWVGFCDGG